MIQWEEGQVERTEIEGRKGIERQEEAVVELAGEEGRLGRPSLGARRPEGVSGEQRKIERWMEKVLEEVLRPLVFDGRKEQKRQKGHSNPSEAGLGDR